MRDILDDLGLVFGRECSEPFCEALLWGNSVNRSLKQRGGRRGTYHFSLPRQEDEVATRESAKYLRTVEQRRRSSLDSHPE